MALDVEWFKTAALEPVLGGIAKFPHDLLIEGIYGGVGTVAAFIQVIWIFFICMVIIEDSGYLSQSAYLMGAFMERLRLDGRSDWLYDFRVLSFRVYLTQRGTEVTQRSTEEWIGRL